MSSRIAETLLSGARAARHAEPAARSGERREPFGPVLNQAISSGGRTPPARRSAFDGGRSATVDDGAEDRDAEARELDDVRSDAAIEAEIDDLSDHPEDDAVEISAEAAAAGVVAANVADAVVLPGQAEGDAAAPVDAAVAAPTPDEAPPEGDDASEGQAGRLREFNDALPPDGGHRIDERVADVAGSPPGAISADSASVEDAAMGNAPEVDEQPATSESDAHTVVQVEAAAGEDAADDGDAPISDVTPGVDTNHASRDSGNSPLAVAEGTAIAEAPGTETALPERSSSFDSPVEPSHGAVESLGSTAGGNLRAAESPVQAPLPTGVDDGNNADRARFVGRVEGAIRAAEARDGRIQVRLSPPELGALRIELNMHQGVMTARIEAETTAARNLLLDNLPALRDRLAQQDVRIDRFDVDVRRDGGGWSQQQMQDRPSAQGDERRSASRSVAPERSAPKSVTGASGVARVTSDGALDVRV